MKRNRFVKNKPRPKGNFCPDCGERITWVTKDKCPCKIKLGFVVHETVGDLAINPRGVRGFVLQDPEPVGRMPVRQDVPIQSRDVWEPRSTNETE